MELPNPANLAVALAVELGSRNVEISPIKRLIIRGLRASRLAKVGGGEGYGVHSGGIFLKDIYKPF